MKKILVIGIFIIFVFMSFVSANIFLDKISGNAVEGVICTASDGTGINLPVKGICTDEEGAHTDYCNENGYLIEYYCGPTMHPVSEQSCIYTTYNCPGMIPGTVCSNGACVEELEINCTDSDGGKDYYEKGITIEDGWYTPTSHFNHQYNDGCGYTANKNSLREFFVLKIKV